MMTIDLNSGELRFKKWTFSPKGKLNYIKSLFLSTEFELWTSNENWLSYRLNISEEFIFILFFENGIIKFIEIYPKNNNEDHDAIAHLLISLGGERSYSWGKIDLNNDRKAGYKSIIIKYN